MRIILATPLIAFCAIAGASADPWTPDAGTISKLESVIRLPDFGQSRMYPKGHIPAVTEFARYYTGSINDGHRIVLGTFIDADRDHPRGVYVVADSKSLPAIFDGGCHIVNVLYDADAEHVVSVKCNGLG